VKRSLRPVWESNPANRGLQPRALTTLPTGREVTVLRRSVTSRTIRCILFHSKMNEDPGICEMDELEPPNPVAPTDERVTPAPVEPASEWNAAQQQVIKVIGKNGARPALSDELRLELLDELEGAAKAMSPLLSPGAEVFVSKHHLATVFQCEARYVAEDRRSFAWTVSTARGTIAHRAIELLVHLDPDVPAATVVDEAISRLVSSDAPISRFLRDMDQFDRSDLVSGVVNQVARFRDSFPTLRPQWTPTAESNIKLNLAGGLVRLSGKVDLTLGRAPDKVIIDIKTGWPSASHRDDLRFYALLDLLCLGDAPRKVASFYLDSAEIHAEDITEDTLRSAARRTADGIERIVSLLRGGEVPTRTPQPSCRWCVANNDCEPGRNYLAIDRDDSDY
jgi:RecB family exonuclease